MSLNPITVQDVEILTAVRSGRRAGNNRIRGPQSALTDFLASNNISAAQISQDYQRRQAEAQQRADQEAAARGETAGNGDDNENQNENGDEQVDEAQVEAIAKKKKKKRDQEKSLAKIKADKKKAQKKRKSEHSDDGDEDDDDEEGLFNSYAKKQPLPGQLENCELCDKRFTVTPYSKAGPDGGLLCVKCSKEQETERKKGEKAKKQAVSRDKRRKVQSSLLDGIVQIGAKSLQELCVKASAYC